MKRLFYVMLILSVIIPALAGAQELYDLTTLRTIELRFSQSDWWQQLINNNTSETNLAATLIIDNTSYDSVGVRFRGNTSYSTIGNSQKKSFNIELDWIKDQDFQGYATLNLNNGYEDPTFMREVLYSNACGSIFPSAKTNFVKLTINGENWGVYVNVQQLDGRFIRDWFSDNDGSRWRGEGGASTGNQPGGVIPTDPGGTVPTNPGGTPPTNPGGVVPTNPGTGGVQSMIGGGVSDGQAALSWLGTDSSKYQSVYSLKATKEEKPWQALIHTCDVLNNTALDSLPTELPKVLNVDEALWQCAFEIVFEDDDGYVNKRGSDYYIYHDYETGQMNLMQFDGNASMIVVSNHTPYPVFYRATDTMVPLMNRLMAVPEYRQRYLAHVRTILDHYLTEAYLLPQIDSFRALIEADVQLDTKKLYSNQEFDSNITALKNYVATRRAFLLADAKVRQAPPVIVAVNESTVSGSALLTITAQIAASPVAGAVHLFTRTGDNRLFQSQPMYDDAGHGDGAAGDGVYGVTLASWTPGATLYYYVQAIAADAAGTMAFLPEAEHLARQHVFSMNQAAISTVVINEFMAQNKTTLTDPQNEYDDWIELFNQSGQAVDLAGKYLSDDPAQPLKWKFPDSTMIPANGYLIVWADEDGTDSPGLHANFKLSASGEVLWLCDSDANGNVLLDSLTFSTQTADVSYGRISGSPSVWSRLVTPTPGQENGKPSAVVYSSTTPATFLLHPAYPNPFNASTTISFSLPSAQRAVLKIYDRLGREVEVLLDAAVAAGNYNVNWQAAHLASGVYFVRLTAGSFMSHRQVLLLK